MGRQSTTSAPRENEPTVPGKESRPASPSIRWGQEVLLLAATVLLLAGVDQWTKGWAVQRLGPLNRDASGRLRPPPTRLRW